MNEFKNVPLQPTKAMIEEGAQRLVSWDDGCEWPDSWSPLQVSAARTEAERVWRSMWCECCPAPVGYESLAVRMAKAIQRFRNLDMLRDLVELRGTQEYHDLCLAWKEFDDATEKQHRADL